jgi:hypothetical protein
MPVKMNLLIANACLVLMLNGCASSMSESPAGAATKPVSVVPVFVTPNCQILAGEQHCYWIEPRGMKPSEPQVEPESVNPVQGIAL